MITRFLAVTITAFLSCAVFAGDDVNTDLSAVSNADTIMADNRRKDRRDDRGDNRDDKQDCRQEEGVVGGDKRECKHEGPDDGDKAPEADVEPEADA